MLRIPATFLTLLLLWVAVAQVNHVLSDFQVYLFVGGLFVAYSALTLRLREGMLVSALAGLLCDAAMPIPVSVDTSAVSYGLAHTHLLLFCLAHAVVYNLRDRIPRNETAARVLVALFANLGIFLLFSFIHVTRSPSPASVWPRLIADLACSQVFLALIAPWFFALQTRVLALAATERDNLA
ncbi:MAG TPA: hypothetical protein VHO24_20600 [Opitutaceae bacterium]|nr:hypothetical protein [Opitutaceae bacterium]